MAYLFYGDRFLMLKRKHQPTIWSPPGGHLYPNEKPEEGLLREIQEETGIKAKILMPVNTWMGNWNGETTLSIDFLAVSFNQKVVLSDEHDNYCWVTLEQLTQGKPVQLDERLGVPIHYFEFAYKLYKYLWQKNRLKFF
jgi:8-oxo-dGTP pyrophosphatase MutT (NUDIX family)